MKQDKPRVVWRKSSRSNGQNNCVEVAAITGVVAVRDSKHPTNPSILLPTGEWTALLTNIRAGRHDV